MTDQIEILKQLELLENWALISYKKKILKNLEKIISQGEKIKDVIEGFYSDNDLNEFNTLGGVLVLTNKQLIFISYEKNRIENYLLSKIKDIKSYKKHSSVKIVFNLSKGIFNFRSFFSNYKIKNFIQEINSNYKIENVSAPQQSKDPFDTFENNPLSGFLTKIEDIIKKTSQLGKETPKKDRDGLDFLFKEAEKIHELLIPIIKNKKLKELILDDLITLATLSTMADAKLNRNEAYFIILTLFDFNSANSPEQKAFQKNLFKKNSFPEDVNQFIKDNEAIITNLIKNQHIDKENKYTLKSLIYIQEYDRETGSVYHDILESIYLKFTQCIIKADGKITKNEKTSLKNIQFLISHNNTISKEKELESAPQQKEEPGTEAAEETLDQVMEEINSLIGMENIKEEINTFINLIKIQKERKERGLPVTTLSLHAVFYGPPGTGKTTIARILGRIYKCLGLLKKGHLTETDRAGLVAGYVGQTAIKTDEIIQKSLDGILFIDEAYTLSPGRSSGQDFGQEAIDTILKRMEDSRERFVVIVAGYPDEMKDFITSNPGLKSRFSRYFYFNHYEPGQLLDIFYIFSNKAKFIIDKKAKKALLTLFTNYYTERDKAFGNGRLVRNIFEKIIERQANRIAEITPLTDKILCTIKKKDIPEKEDIME